MIQLLRTEWLKLKNYPAFWWLMGISLLCYPGINGFIYLIYDIASSQRNESGEMINQLIGKPFSFPEIFRSVAHVSSYFVFIPAVLILMQISNEFTYKTNRQNIIDGWSRRQFMTAKFLGVLLVSVLILMIYVAFVLVVGYITTDHINASSWKMAHYTALFGLQVFSQLSLAFLLGLILRRAFIALGIFIFYMLIFENILVGILRWKANDAGRFLFLEVSDRLTPAPAFFGQLDTAAYTKSLEQINTQVWITIIYTILFWVAAFRIYEKRDL
jgi:ABC-type transport system involved in multi-copper enzyme maturation permease subunit